MEPDEPAQPASPDSPLEAEAVPPLEALPHADHPGGHAHRIDPPAPAGPVEYVQPVELVQPVESAGPVELVQPVQAVEYVTSATARELRAQRIALAIYTVVGIVSVLILVRVLLRLLAANPDAPFSQFWYALTAPFVLPFAGVFPQPSYRNSALEISSILAIAIYWLLAWIAVRLVRLANRAPTPAP